MSFEKLYHLLEETSRTFAVGISYLPEVLRQSVCIGYLLLRVSDYFEDNAEMPIEKKLYFLNLWAEILERKATPADFAKQLERDPPPPSHLADQKAALSYQEILEGLQTLPKTVQCILTRYTAESTRGMAFWLEKNFFIESEKNLEDYMFEVAGRVGHLLVELFAWFSWKIQSQADALMDLGRGFGLGLQTINVIRGLHDDRIRGCCYVPRQWLQQEGFATPEKLFDSENVDRSLLVVQKLIAKGEQYLHQDALPFLLKIPRCYYGIRIFCALPLFFALKTLTLCRDNPLVLQSEVKIKRSEVGRIVLGTRLGVWSNRWVQSYAKKL